MESTMKKRRPYDRLFEGNKLVLMCVLFTVNLFIETIAATILDVPMYMTLSAFAWRMTWLSAPVLPLTILQYLWEADYITEDRYLLWISIPVHFALSAGLLLLYVFIWGRFYPLLRGAYIETLLTYGMGYAIIIIGAMVVDAIQVSTTNKNLKKIQASRTNSK